MNSEHQFKLFLIAIIFVVSGVIVVMIKPDFSDLFDKDSVLRLSSQKPWQEEFSEDEEVIDDVDINVSYPENKFKTAPKNPFKLGELMPQDEEEYWVTGSIPINPMTNLNNKTKSDIYNKRKYYVEQSIFKNRRYAPSETVFGQIESKKPWLSIDALTCHGRGQNASAGLSEETRYINNPTMLIGLDRISFDEKPKKLCSPVDYLIPVKINYSKDENTIKIIFEVSSYQGDLGTNFLLKGLNARDLGFGYAYADILNSVAFVQKNNNISNDVYAFRDFIHLGTACGVKGGCNNGSPFQKELNFTVIKYPASIHLKLWKKRPKDYNQKSDINYLIILR